MISAAPVVAPPGRVPEDLLTVARLVPVTAAEGPGSRTALWVQGCSIRCAGCFNPQLWSTRGGTIRGVADLANAILDDAAVTDVEGITFLGGEPFEQAAPLAQLAALLKDGGLSVMTFTGYELGLLRQWAGSRSDIAALLESTDLLADGPYRQDMPETSRPWIGSTNQGLHILTERYADLVAGSHAGPDRLEVRVTTDGVIAVNGWANVDALEQLLGGLGRRMNEGDQVDP